MKNRPPTSTMKKMQIDEWLRTADNFINDGVDIEFYNDIGYMRYCFYYEAISRLYWFPYNYMGVHRCSGETFDEEYKSEEIKIMVKMFNDHIIIKKKEHDEGVADYKRMYG